MQHLSGWFRDVTNSIKRCHVILRQQLKRQDATELPVTKSMVPQAKCR